MDEIVARSEQLEVLTPDLLPFETRGGHTATHRPAMAREMRKRGRSEEEPEEDEPPARTKRGRASAPAPSQRDAKAAKHDKGKAPTVEPAEVVELEDLEDDDVDPKDADVVHMVRRGDTRTSERYEYRDERR